MIFKKKKPTTPTIRNLIQLQNKTLAKKPIYKNLLKKKKKSIGKNNTGQITMYHRGGGVKRQYRKIDFLRKKPSIDIVICIEYDPNRTAHIAVLYNNEEKTYKYIIAPKHLKIGDIVKSGFIANHRLGHSLKISEISIGTFIHNISNRQDGYSIFVRTAGNFAKLIEKNRNSCKIQLSNNKIIRVPSSCRATIGKISNENNNLQTLGKAGRNRWLNKRPIVRGVAMNPIDHPHGGGEGKTSGGRPSVSPWGKLCKKSKKINKYFKNESII